MMQLALGYRTHGWQMVLGLRITIELGYPSSVDRH